jgi:hypothetical protein
MFVFLFEYNLNVRWKPGKQIPLADHLSRSRDGNKGHININNIEKIIMAIDMTK